MPETDSEQRLENVVFQSDGRGPGEQQHEPVKNQAVRVSRRMIAAVDGAAAEHRGEHGGKPRPKSALQMQGRAAAVLADLHIHAVEEYRYRGVAEYVKEPHFGR